MTEQKHTKELLAEFDIWFNNLLFSYEKTQSCFFRDVIRANKLNMQKEYLRLCDGGEEELNSILSLEAKAEDLRQQRDELREALEKIAIIREEDPEKYVVKADQIACEALTKCKEQG